MEIKETFTNRGFKLFEFTDRYGCECSLQESSLAEEAAIWLGVTDAEPIIMASKVETKDNRGLTGWVKYPIPEDVFIGTRMHLTQDQVKELLPLLQKFAETGEL